MSIYDVDMSEEQILREECSGESWKKEEIEVGEYVRTKDGHIAKYIEKLAKYEDVSDGMLFDGYIYEKHKHIRYRFLKEIIVKHSKQLINVLEKGDMIITREDRIYKLDSVIKGELYCDYYKYHDTLIIINIDEVSMILTKEKMRANCYKVGGE